jgi:hypothetical protein
VTRRIRLRHRVLHYNSAALWDVNLCGVRGTWSATGDVRKVTCKGCRRHLTYWVKRAIRAHRVHGDAGEPSGCPYKTLRGRRKRGQDRIVGR